jgi:PAS domain S-box-containing protein|nr:PAS domain-containing protein [Candidatus Krumholzibacteria bacterium]
MSAPVPDAHSQDQLALSEQRYRSVFDRSPMGIATLTLADGVIRDANPNLCRLLGLELEEILGRTLASLTHPDDLVHDQAATDRRQDGYTGEIDYEKRLLHKNGRAIWVRVFSTPLESAPGQPPEILGLVLDLSHQKDAENQRLDYQQKLEVVLRSSRIGMWDWNIPSGSLVLDEIWAHMIGYELEELQPTNISTFFDNLHPDDLPLSRQALDRHLKGEQEFYECQLRFKHKQGHWIWVLARGRVVEWEDGRIPVRMLGTHSEITDIKDAENKRRELELQVLQAQKLESLGVLAGGIAHDFNNILMVIQGHAELARATLGHPGESVAFLDQIQSSVRQATDLCAQMLAYSGKGSFLIGDVFLDGLVEDMLPLLQTSVTRKVQLDVQQSGEVKGFRGDQTQVRQVVMNLVINAAEALGDEGGTVELFTSSRVFTEEELARDFPDEKLEPGTYTVFTVKDEGCGMDETTRRRVFEPFFSTKFTGRGLGMAAVQGIVHAHEGGLHLETAPGQGTIFTIIFPAFIETQQPTSESPRVLEHSLPQGHTIMVVDDEPLVLDLTARMVEKLGFSVLKATDGYEALCLHDKHRHEISCILLDLTMPSMDGEEAYRELQRQQADVRVVLCSGYSEKDIERRFFGTGLTHFLHKPYSLEQLQDILSLVLS